MENLKEKCYIPTIKQFEKQFIKQFEVNCINEKSYHDTFQDAFCWLFNKMKENPPTTYMCLETMIWIVNVNHVSSFMDFYSARDYAYDIGLMKDGQLVYNKNQEKCFNENCKLCLKNTQHINECSSFDTFANNLLKQIKYK